jgi:hypothetical protein
VIHFGRFPFDPAARAAFSAGQLRDFWFKSYPMLFDERDLMLATNQPKNHFFEWLAAVVVYETTGWLSLVEKYQFRGEHPAKYAIFAALVPEGVRHLLAESRYFGDRQGPDLFVYAPDKADWFFCEVKGGADKLRESQATLFATLQRLSGRPVRLITFTDRPALGPQRAVSSRADG